jgi:hypothetical protein
MNLKSIKIGFHRARIATRAKYLGITYPICYDTNAAKEKKDGLAEHFEPSFVEDRARAKPPTTLINSSSGLCGSERAKTEPKRMLLESR